MLLDLDYRTVGLSLGPQVTLELRPLELGAYHDVVRVLAPVLTEVGAPDDPALNGRRLQLLAGEDVRRVAESVIPPHARNLSGVNLREQGSVRPATVEDLVRYGAFTRACLDVLLALLDASRLTPDDAGKCAGPSGSFTAPDGSGAVAGESRAEPSSSG